MTIKIDKSSSKYRGVWTPNTYYDQSDMVFYGGAMWIADVAFTSGVTFDNANWTCPTCDDSAPALVIITSDESDFIDATPFEIQIKFSKPVTGFVVGDITITNATLSNFAGSGKNYTVDVTPNVVDDILIQVLVNVTIEGNAASNVVVVNDSRLINRGWDNLGTAFVVSGSFDEILTNTTGNLSKYAQSNTGISTGYYYAELDVTNNGGGTGRWMGGVVKNGAIQQYVGNMLNSIGIMGGGVIRSNGGSGGTTVNLVTGNYLRIWIRDGSRVWIAVNQGGVDTFVGGGNPQTDTTPTYTFGSPGIIHIASTPFAASSVSTLRVLSSEFLSSKLGATAWDE